MGAATENSRIRTFQIRDLKIIVFFDEPLMQLFRRKQLHQMAVSGKGLGKDRPIVHMGCQKLLVDTAAEKGRTLQSVEGLPFQERLLAFLLNVEV